jgi:hypothetical protein
MLFRNWLWHLKGVAAKYFSVIHAPAKRIFGDNCPELFIKGMLLLFDFHLWAAIYFK